MIVGMVLLAALAVAGLALIFRPVFGSGGEAPSGVVGNPTGGAGSTREHGPALSIIEERYARGEIGRDEFLALRRSLFEGE